MAGAVANESGSHARAEAAVDAARWLRDATRPLDAGVAWTYRPLDYAWEVHEAYLRRYVGRPRALLVGMNPGPWGMGQTGVPFGDPVLVGQWLGLADAPVHPPAGLHPKRPVLGWASKRREGSGKRLWDYLRNSGPDPRRALRDVLIVNHCPLLLFDEAGRNITPDKLPRAQREPLLQVCDAGIERMARATGAQVMVGIGRYAEKQCLKVAEDLGAEVTQIPHPSPASPVANQDGGRIWAAAVDATLRDIGIE
jgi:single-strand selective monofunctional uracil DNA glycosylase